MQWIHDYQFFLFDFDGLLVNTEELHFLAYQKMCRDRGFELPWNYQRYCLSAHYDPDKLRKDLLRAVPELDGVKWETLYSEKKLALEELLIQGPVHLMPGAENLLIQLEKENLNRCVVTNSTKEQIAIIQEKIPLLRTIPHWFTRETYSHPKPHPECYVNAIKQLGKGAKKMIGFEDTPRGLRALMQTPVKAVFISQIDYPDVKEYFTRGVSHFPSLQDIEL